MKYISLAIAGLLVFFTSTAQNAQAAGFYIQEQSVSGLGSAYAGIAAMPRDASTIYYNPAGMTYLGKTSLNIGANGIYGNTDMNDTGSTLFGPPISGGGGGNPVGLNIIPNLYAAQELGYNLWAGIGVTFPFGLSSKYDSDWFGRYDSIKSDLRTIDVQPTLAWKATDWFSIGAGLNYEYADVELTNAVNDGAEGLSKLKGDDKGSFGYTVGILLEPIKGTRIGANYKSSVHHDFDGRASVSGTLGSDFDIGAHAKLTTPDIASVAVSQAISQSLTIMAQANWFGWNNFDAITVRNDAGVAFSSVPQNYQTTWSFSGGVEYIVNKEWTVRAGYQFDQTPTTDLYRTTRTPDGDRNWFSVGGTYNWDKHVTLDLAATYINVSDESINLSRNFGTANVNADVTGDIGIVGMSLNYKF